MVDSVALENAIKEAGFTITDFAEEIGISRASFYLKIRNKREFKSREISRICSRLNLDIYKKDAIFLQTM